VHQKEDEMAFVIAVALLMALSTVYLVQQFRSGALSDEGPRAASAPEEHERPADTLKAA
jgi:hypothetical protein